MDMLCTVQAAAGMPAFAQHYDVSCMSRTGGERPMEAADLAVITCSGKLS